MTIASAEQLSREGALLARVKDGDKSAFEDLYRAYSDLVFGICHRMADGRQDAEGMAQDVWVKVWERAGTFRDESAFSTWLHRLTVNLVLDRKRRVARRRLMLEDSVPEWAARAVLPRPRAEEAMDLASAVRDLPSGARLVFVLHDVEGYKHREIAERLGIAEGTVKSQLHRARRLLREALSA